MKRSEFVKLFCQYKAERMQAEGERPSVIAMTASDTAPALRLWSAHREVLKDYTPEQLRAEIFKNVKAGQQ